MTTGGRLAELLQLDHAPVAVAFGDAPPEGLNRIDSAAVSGCTYWKFASEGQAFYTEASDHCGCPVGAHTHGVDMPAETATELEGLIGTMVELQYLDPAEIPQIPQQDQPWKTVAYAPAASATFQPDVVIVIGSAREMMLLAEATQAAGVSCESSLVGRPTCAAIPAVMKSSQAAANLGCIGNRVYTEMDDNELYFAISGPQLGKIVDKLETIVNANRELEKFHTARMS